MTELTLGHLPDLPQTEYLRDLAERLWRRRDLVALWLGGSLAAGNADRYSDVDLRIAVAEADLASWQSADLDALFGQSVLAHTPLTFGKSLLHHTLLENGDLYDLYIQASDAPLSNEVRLVLGCRDEALQERLRAEPQGYALHKAVEPEAVARLLESYWLNAHKHRKALHRGLPLLACEGLNRFRPVLVRLAYALETGRDCGEVGRLTIHGFSPVDRALAGTGVLETVGLPTSERQAIVRALDALHTAVSRVGRDLADRYGFAYPDGLEAVVLGSWVAFKQNEPD